MGRTEVVSPGLGRWFVSTWCCSAAVAAFLCIVVGPVMSSSAQAQVVIFDGFDDADRDNDGFSDDGNNTPVAVNDGIPWYSVNGLIGATMFHKPLFSIRDDPSPGFGTGNALEVNPFGDNADWAGFFGQTITLGPNVGDKLVVSFDMYHDTDVLFQDAATFTTVRFGLWQDSDNQLGMASLDGRDTDPNNPTGPATIWGGSDGYFENSAFQVEGTSIGTFGDYGVWGRVQSGTVESANRLEIYTITEEMNTNISTGGNDDNEVIAAADGMNGNALFSDMPVVDNTPHTLSLTLERVAPDATGQDVRFEAALDGMAFGAQPPNPVDGMPDNGAIMSRDSFDYFMMVQNSDVGNYMIDNFQVELIAANPTLEGDYNGDGNVDAADYVVWRKDPASFGGDPGGYNTWRANFGESSPAAGSGSAAVPEPTLFLCTMPLLFGIFLGLRCCRREHFLPLE